MRIQLKIKEAYEALGENLRLKNEIEERKLAEINMKILQRRLASMLDLVEDAVLTIDENEEIHFCNSSFEDLTGYTGRELLWRPLADLFSDKAKKRFEKLRREMSHMHTPGKTDQIKKYQRFTIKKRNEEELPVEMLLSPLELEDETFFVFIFRKPTLLPVTSELSNPGTAGIALIEELNRNRSRIQSLEEALSEGIPKLMTNDAGFKNKLKTIDTALEQLGHSLIGETKSEEKRKLAVEVMNLAVDCWYKTNHSDKIELAQKSKIWKVYEEADGRDRTQTLDKYCDIMTLPRNPRWKNIVNTADFVLSFNDAPSESKDHLELALAKFLAVG